MLAKRGAFGAAADAAAGSGPQGQLRLAAACALLKLLRVAQLQIEVHLMEAPERWHALGMVMQDADADVREAFALKLSKELGRAFNGSKAAPNKAGTPAHFLHTRRLCVPPYYMAFFALAAGDADKVSSDPDPYPLSPLPLTTDPQPPHPLPLTPNPLTPHPSPPLPLAPHPSPHTLTRS